MQMTIASLVLTFVSMALAGMEPAGQSLDPTPDAARGAVADWVAQVGTGPGPGNAVRISRIVRHPDISPEAVQALTTELVRIIRDPKLHEQARGTVSYYLALAATSACASPLEDPVPIFRDLLDEVDGVLTRSIMMSFMPLLPQREAVGQLLIARATAEETNTDEAISAVRALVEMEEVGQELLVSALREQRFTDWAVVVTAVSELAARGVEVQRGLKRTS